MHIRVHTSSGESSGVLSSGGVARLTLVETETNNLGAIAASMLFVMGGTSAMGDVAARAGGMGVPFSPTHINIMLLAGTPASSFKDGDDDEWEGRGEGVNI